MRFSYPYALFTAARVGALLSCLPLLAQAITWDGGGVSNTSGTWETGGNWNPDGVPLSSDSVILDDVTSGTRTVTISSGSGQAINDLTITQTTGGAINKLSVEEDFTVSSTSNPLAFTSSAGQGGIVIDIAAGKTFSAARTTGSLTANLDGTFNLAANSAFTVAATEAAVTNSDLTLNGPVTALAGSTIKVSGGSASLTLNGDSIFASGSTLKLEYTAPQGNAIFTNNAIMSMDAATLDFAWEATAGNNAGIGRNFNNTGDWTMANGSSIVLSSTTGRPTGGGNAVSVDNQNSGTMRVESGSTVSSRKFFNTGTLQLGSQTAGTTDAQIHWGGQITADIEFHNGRDAAGTAAVGIVNVLGDTLMGHSATTAVLAVFNGSATSTGSVFNVGDGTTVVNFTLQSGNVAFTNYAGNTLNLKANTTTLLKSLLTTNTGGATTITNNGAIVHAGNLQIQGNKTGTRSITTASTGSYRVDGLAAVLRSNESTSGPTGSDLTLNFTNSGILSGSSAADKLTYVNGTSKTTFDVLAMNQTGGEITAGFGSNGSGTSSIGSLELVNTNLTLSGTTKMSFDLGSTVGSGLFDSLILSGNGAVFTLGGSETLDIRLVNGFTPADGTYTLVSATSVGGIFANLLLDGSDAAGAYTIDYAADSISISFAAIPEPATWSLLMGLAVGGMAFCRRRRN